MLVDEIKKANIQALKDHDIVKRSLYAVLLNKMKLCEIDRRAAGKPFTEEDAVSVLQKTEKELTEERDSFLKANRPERVAELNTHLEIVKSLLPQMMTEEEIRAVIATLEDKSIPAVMKHFKANYAGKCDMRLVQAVVKTL